MNLKADLDANVRQALHEDIADGDITAALIPAERQSRARVITREAAVICGIDWFNRSFELLDERVHIDWLVSDGDEVIPDQELCLLSGPTRALLTGERTALNFLQTLSATATVSRHFVSQLEGTGTRLLDTRKTIPGLRLAQKYAVKTGGGKNHRIGLFDGVLIKENHIEACGSIAQAVSTARQQQADIPVEVEVESLVEVQQALDAGADILLLDNFSLDMMREAVALNQGRASLEASGGFELERLRDTAATGVDFISVGALTKHVRAIDLSMRIV